MNEVEAVKSAEQRDQVEKHLVDFGEIYRDVWRFGINTALRISDLLNIRMADVAELDPDRPVLTLREGKTGKMRHVRLNRAALAVIERRRSTYPAAVWLFQTDSPKIRKKDPQPITRRSVGRVFEQVGGKIRPRVQMGTHSMRKTRGYAMHEAGRPIEEICKVMNHSHPAITMRYIGITQEDIDRSYTEFEL